MKKQLIGISAIALSSLLLVACGQKSVKSGSSTIYDTTVNKTTVSDHEWKITGTTSAPDGAKIIVTPTSKSNLDYGENGATNYDEINWAKVKNGKFTAYVDPLDITMSKKSGNQTKVAVMAVTGYSKKYDDDVSSKAVSAFTKQFETYKLKMSSSQAKYLKSLGSDDDDTDYDSTSDDSTVSSSESSSTSSTDTTSYQTVTYDQIARNPDDYQDSEVKLSGQVMQVQNAHNGSVVLLWLNDDPDQLVMVGINKDYMPDNGNILEDDEITVYGTGDGTQKYDTTSGAKNEVPFVRADATTTDSGKSNSAY